MNAPNPGSTAPILGASARGDSSRGEPAFRLPAGGLAIEAVNTVLRTDEPAIPDAADG